MSDLARLTVDLALRLGAEQVVSLGCRAPERLAEVAVRVPVLALDGERRLESVRGLSPQLRALAWEPGEPLPDAVHQQARTSLLICDGLLEQLDDPAPVLATLRELLEEVPAALISSVDRDLLPAEDGPPARWNAEELLALLARSGLETVWAGVTDTHGSLGRRAGLTCATSRNRPGEVRAALAPGPLGLGFDPGATLPPRAEKPRVCIASYEFVGPTRTGGIGTAYTSLAEALADAEHEVTLLFTGWEEGEGRPFNHWVREYRERGIELLRLPQAAPRGIETGHRHAVRSYQAYHRLRELERERPFDVIHFPEVLGHGYYTISARRLGIAFQRTTIAVGTHSSTSWVLEANGTVFQAIDDFADDFIERRSVEMCDVLISPSAYMLDWMRARGWNLPERHFVQQYARSLAAKPAAPEVEPDPGAGGGEDETELVFFGRLEPRKGVRVFCDALDRLARLRPAQGCRVTFLGKRSSIDGIDAAEYLRERRREWPWPVEVIDGLGQPDALAYLRSPGRRLTVIPSLADNSPNTVYEALALGIPFLASRVGGTAELIDPRDLAWATFDPEADRPGCAERGTEALAERLATALATPELGVPRPAVAPDACRDAHVYWHGAVAAGSAAAEREPGPVSIAVAELGGEPSREDADAILFVPPGAGVTLDAIGLLERAAGSCDAEVIAIPVLAGERGRDRVTRVPVGGPPIGGLLRRCFGDGAFLIRTAALERLGGLAAEVDPADRAHHLLCRAAIAGMRIEVLPEPLVIGPPGSLEPISIVEQSHRRTAILDAYADAPQEVLAGLPLLAQQLYAAAERHERDLVDLYENRFGRFTLPIRRSVGRARRVRRTLRRDPGPGRG